MCRWFPIIILILAPAIQTKAQAGTKKLPEIYFSIGTHRMFFSPSDIHVNRKENPSLDFRLFNVKGRDEGGLIFDTAPQFSLNLGFYSPEKKFGLEISYDHGKYFSVMNQEVHLRGQIEGRYYDTDTTLTPYFFRMEHTDGANYAMLNLVKFIKLAALKKEKHVVEVVLKAGGGFVHPRSNSTVLGLQRDDRYHIAGYVTGIETGLRLSLFNYFTVTGSFKGCYANYNDILIAGGKASQSWFSGQFNYYLGGRIPIR